MQTTTFTDEFGKTINLSGDASQQKSQLNALLQSFEQRVRDNRKKAFDEAWAPYGGPYNSEAGYLANGTNKDAWKNMPSSSPVGMKDPVYIKRGLIGAWYDRSYGKTSADFADDQNYYSNGIRKDAWQQIGYSSPRGMKDPVQIQKGKSKLWYDRSYGKPAGQTQPSANTSQPRTSVSGTMTYSKPLTRMQQAIQKGVSKVKINAPKNSAILNQMIPQQLYNNLSGSGAYQY